MAYIFIDNLSFTYSMQEAKAIERISLEFDQGDFVLFLGPSGSGKSTLLKMLAGLPMAGKKEGEIFYDNRRLESYSKEEVLRNIAYVYQELEHGLFSNDPKQELAFSMENLAMDSQEIRLRMAEIASYMGIESLLDIKTAFLSSGEKMLLQIASRLVLHPHILLLDEPTTYLDPIQRRDLFARLQRLKEESNVTILMAEHHVKEALFLADSLVLFQQGKIEKVAKKEEMLSYMLGENHPLKRSLLPMDSTLKEEKKRELIKKLGEKKEELVRLEDVSFSFEKKGRKIIQSLDMILFKGEVVGLMGPIASGKTTLLKLLYGIYKPKFGKIRGELKKMIYLPQDPSLLFSKDMAWEEVTHLPEDFPKELSPFELSCGQKQLLALFKLFDQDFSLALFDEPTKGLDGIWLAWLEEKIQLLKKKQKTFLLVSHDMDFLSRTCDRIAFLFQGELVCLMETGAFFEKTRYFKK